MILWHTDTDELEFGQWFKGRIYRSYCDLSPDGSVFLYIAAKWNRFTLRDREYTYAWTAISKPPYLTALALWPAVEFPKHKSGERGILLNGGGLFLDNRTIWLNHKPELAKPHPDHKPRGLSVIARQESPVEVGLERIAKDGWTIAQQGKVRWSGGNWVVEVPWILEKRNKKRPESVLLNVTRSYRKEDFSVRNETTGVTRVLSEVDWAEWDQQGRLVYSRGCALFAADAEDPMAAPKLIGDFSAQTFVPAVAPEWAKQW